MKTIYNSTIMSKNVNYYVFYQYFTLNMFMRRKAHVGLQRGANPFLPWPDTMQKRSYTTAAWDDRVSFFSWIYFIEKLLKTHTFTSFYDFEFISNRKFCCTTVKYNETFICLKINGKTLPFWISQLLYYQKYQMI